MIFTALYILSRIVDFYCLLIFVWVILSWFRSTKNKTVRDIYRALDKIVGPYVNLFRKIIPPMGGLDFTPVVALIVLQLLSRLVFGLLVGLV